MSDLSDEQLKVLQALSDLGGRDVHIMDIAKKLGFDKKYLDSLIERLDNNKSLGTLEEILHNAPK